MALLEVLKFPDQRLRLKAAAIEKVTPELKALAENMLETMYKFNGIGLAAPQVGESVRLLVMDCRAKSDSGGLTTEGFSELELTVKQPVIIFNPQLMESQGKTSYEEGCLSVPSYYETVQRYEYVEVKGLDIEGNEFWIKTDGLVAICLQHEMDHLDGKLFIDRLSLIKSNMIKNKIKKFGYPSKKETDEDSDERRL